MFCLIGFDKIAYAKELVEKLQNKSAELDCKVDDVQEIVGNFKCAFDSLKDDVTVLESAESELLGLERELESELKQHSVESECDLDDLLTLVEKKKEVVSAIEEMAIPCGGLGWKRVEYRDFRNTACYDELESFVDEPHLCGVQSGMTDDCTLITISVNDMEYNSVCGRIKAFQYGTPNGFSYDSNIGNTYLTGISLTNGRDGLGGLDSHIWSFVAGQSQMAAPGVVSTCPCDGGPTLPDQSQMGAPGAVTICSCDSAAPPPAQSQMGAPGVVSTCPCDGGAPSPSFVGEDYFCEAAITTNISDDPTMFDNTFFSRNPLWDGEGCIASSTCCSRINHPYFIKHLETPTTNDIDLRVCIQDDDATENILIEIVELYIKFTD